MGDIPAVGRRLLDDGGWLTFEPDWLDPELARTLMSGLPETLPLRLRKVTVFGREHFQPRLTSWHADPGCVYTYSGLAWDPEGWTEALATMRSRLRAELAVPFNSVLANLYRDGADSMGWHADDESCFGRDPVIASVSLGGPRRFLLRHRRTRETVELSLGSGSLLVMGGATQRFWQHAIPKTSRPVQPRLNLTWRHFLSGATKLQSP